jgi:hypothetical protein
VTERFRRVDHDHLELDITMTDPKALVKPWTTTFYYQLRPEWELGEISCAGDYLDFSKFENFSFKENGAANKLQSIQTTFSVQNGHDLAICVRPPLLS